MNDQTKRDTERARERTNRDTERTQTSGIGSGPSQEFLQKEVEAGMFLAGNDPIGGRRENDQFYQRVNNQEVDPKVEPVLPQQFDIFATNVPDVEGEIPVIICSNGKPYSAIIKGDIIGRVGGED